MGLRGIGHRPAPRERRTAHADRRPSLSHTARWPRLDTPEPPLNQAFAWAAERVPSGVRAEEGLDPESWDGSDFGHLVEEARAFRRVGAGALPDPAGFLREVVAGLFGVGAAGAGGRYPLSPWVPEGWKSLALRRIRCHRTLVDLDVRPRADWCAVRLNASFGPAIPVAVSLRNTPPVARLTVDEVELARAPAIFTLTSEHEVVFFYGDAS